MMRRLSNLAFFTTVCVLSALLHAADLNVAKTDAIKWVDQHAPRLEQLSNTIWLFAEPPLQEYRSSALLALELEAAGFKVEMSVAGMDTAFVATYGQGKPVIATYAEYDTTEGLSQAPVPYPIPLVEGAGGFQDMHNGLGTGAVGAALAVKAVMEKMKIPGTLKVFGTPAEKLCVGKPYIAKAGLFKDVDALIAWHPASKTDAEPGWGGRFLAYQGERFIFKGKSVYGANPWQGTSALDGVALMDVAVQYMREHVLPPEAHFSINSIVSDGGQAPTALPGSAEAWYVWRADTAESLKKIREGLMRCAKAAALATQTEFSSVFVAATPQNLPNIALAKAVHRNIELVGAPKLTAADKEFGREMEKSLGAPPSAEPFDLTIKAPSGVTNWGAADDFTEFSWIAPTHRVAVTYGLAGSGAHWTGAALAATNVGHQSELTAAKIIAASILDLYLNPSLLDESKKEFAQRTATTKWQSLIPDGQVAPRRPPLPDAHYKAMKEACEKLPACKGLSFVE